MRCQFYDTDSLFTLNEKERLAHIEACPKCAERVLVEDKIELQAKQLPVFEPAGAVWQKIENTIIETGTGNKREEKGKKHTTRYWLAAAALLFTIITTGSFYFFSTGNSGNILSTVSLLKIELTEKSYMSAIEDLEAEANPKMNSMNSELSMLYRIKLETIDEQIGQCTDAININPGNAHIRKYMLAALQDKKETLIEIIRLDERSVQ